MRDHAYPTCRCCGSGTLNLSVFDRLSPGGSALQAAKERGQALCPNRQFHFDKTRRLYVRRNSTAHAHSFRNVIFVENSSLETDVFSLPALPTELLEGTTLRRVSFHSHFSGDTRNTFMISRVCMLSWLLIGNSRACCVQDTFTWHLTVQVKLVARHSEEIQHIYS